MLATPLQQAKALAVEMQWPGARQLWMAIRRKGLDVTKKVVEELVKARGEKQIFAAPPKAQGKSFAEDVDVRWQMDLADRKIRRWARRARPTLPS